MRSLGKWLAGLALLAIATAVTAAEPLASWNDGAAKQGIVTFVNAVTQQGGKDFVPEPERIAVFDNDGTLWSEQPIYVQFAFMLDQLRAVAPKHPEWQSNAAFKALMAQDKKALAEIGQKPVLELLAVANSGMTVGEYDQSIRNWLKSARHPQLKRPYTELVFAPMQELLGYLRANGFKAFIVSGGSVEFMRPWAEQAYGIPPEQIIGSQQDVTFAMRDGKPVLTRAPKFVFIDDGPGKPVGIYRQIGRRPIAAFGNSDGDLQMLQVTAAGAGRRLMVLVHHDDAEREFAYDRQSHVGKLDRAWDEANAAHWIVVSMKSDWKKVFAFQK
ncbi:MAG TPA: HAD family hydrolase [Steroidobacteraceae bacterium]|nr:HAD family hydrolase [Steroidobacteraceae bacterium]